MLTRIDKILITILSLIYIIISFINFGNSHINNASWLANNTNDSLTISFDQPTNVAKVYFYYGLITGKYHFDYIDANGTHRTLTDSSLNSFPSHYKWGHLNFEPNTMIKSITVVVDEPLVEFKQLAFFDDNDNYLTNINISSTDKINHNNLITHTPPLYTEHNWLSSTAFDEIYYVSSAVQYLRSESPYASVQTQLGILLIAACLFLFGISPFTWRLLPNLCSILLVPLTYLLAKRIFKSTKLASIATIFMMCEFMHYTVGRLALLDSMLTLFVYMVYYFLFNYVESRANGKSFKYSLKYLYATSIFLGMALSTKLNGLFSTIAILFWLIYCELVKDKLSASTIINKTITLILIFTIFPLGILVISYIPGSIITHDNVLSFTINQLTNIYNFNFDGHLNGIPYGYSSNWWSWPLIITPQSVYYWQDAQGYMSSSIALLGNPAIYWVGILATLVLIYHCIKYYAKNYVVNFILVAILSEYLPYILVHRVSFIYYFYPVTPFIVLANTYLCKLLFNQSNKFFHYLAYTYVCICVFLFIAYFPVISGIEVPRSYTVNHLLLPGWNI